MPLAVWQELCKQIKPATRFHLQAGIPEKWHAKRTTIDKLNTKYSLPQCIILFKVKPILGRMNKKYGMYLEHGIVSFFIQTPNV